VDEYGFKDIQIESSEKKIGKILLRNSINTKNGKFLD
jgi:hypothetical protein